MHEDEYFWVQSFFIGHSLKLISLIGNFLIIKFGCTCTDEFFCHLIVFGEKYYRRYNVYRISLLFYWKTCKHEIQSSPTVELKTPKFLVPRISFFFYFKILISNKYVHIWKCIFIYFSVWHHGTDWLCICLLTEWLIEHAGLKHIKHDERYNGI